MNGAMLSFSLIARGMVALGLGVFLHATVGAAAEQANLISIKAASVGLGGKAKAGFWQPVRLTLVAGESPVRVRVEVIAPDGDRTPVLYANKEASEVNLAAGGEAMVLVYAKVGPVGTPLKVQLRSGDGIVWSQDVPGPALLSTQELVVGIGPATGLHEAIKPIRRSADTALQSVQITSASELPDQWWGYEGVDAVVLTTSDADFLSTMSQNQRAALLQWLHLGGRMVLLIGARGEEIAAPGSPWAELLPGRFSEVVPLRERSGLETFTKSELPEAIQRNRPRITRLTQVRGEVLVGEETSASHPLVVHATAGFGEIYFVGLDLDHPSLNDWPGRARLMTAILQRGAARSENSERQSRRTVSHLGYDDLSGQLRTALDQFSGVTMVNFTTVSVLAIVYLLLIGPADFLLLSRLRLPRQLTWFTFPLVASVFVAAAALLAGQAHGRRVRVNQAEIIDVDLARQSVRGTVWTQLYSPATAHYDAKLELSAPGGITEQPQGWLSWQGLPGEWLGGLGSRQIALVNTKEYAAAMPGSSPRLVGLSVPVSASKSLSARWWAKSQLPVDSQLTTDQFGLLGGRFTQPLPIELSECILAHGEKLYRLGILRPGQVVSIDSQSSLNLEWRLTLRSVVESKDVTTPWDQASTDVPRIVQMLMFHEAARGTSYTGLTHRYQSYIDLSEHVRLGEAVLVGRAAEPVAHLRSGADALESPHGVTTWTWYRLILPVKPYSAAQP
jgi:hypothetical protein